MTGTMAKSMNHHDGTAEKVYNIVNKDKMSFRATKFLDQVYDGALKRQCEIECTNSKCHGIGIHICSNILTQKSNCYSTSSSYMKIKIL